MKKYKSTSSFQKSMHVNSTRYMSAYSWSQAIFMNKYQLKWTQDLKIKSDKKNIKIWWASSNELNPQSINRCTFYGAPNWLLKIMLVTQSCRALCNPMVCSWDSPGKNTGVGCHSPWDLSELGIKPWFPALLEDTNDSVHMDKTRSFSKGGLAGMWRTPLKTWVLVSLRL